MRKSRVLLAGVAVAAAAAGTSAFTASNTFDASAQDDAVGYGAVEVSGATISNVAYTQVAGDPGQLESVAFTSTTDPIDPDNVVTMYLREADGDVAHTVTEPQCVVGAWDADEFQVITCTPTLPVPVESFTTVALSLMPE
jgi:hypothetical protein